MVSIVGEMTAVESGVVQFVADLAANFRIYGEREVGNEGLG